MLTSTVILTKKIEGKKGDVLGLPFYVDVKHHITQFMRHTKMFKAL